MASNPLVGWLDGKILPQAFAKFCLINWLAATWHALPPPPCCSSILPVILLLMLLLLQH
jgi:hypothetical protein